MASQEDLKEHVREAFRDNQYPGDDHIVSHKCWECDEVAIKLKGTRWQDWENRPEELCMRGGGIFLLVPEAFRYFLPAFLIASFKDADNYITDALITSLADRKFGHTEEKQKEITMTDEAEFKRLAMQLRSRVSEVAQAFGAGAGTNVDNAERFIHMCIPASWKPRVISGGMWNDDQRQTYGVIHHGIWLDDFPLSIESPMDHEHIRGIWSDVENILRCNLDKIKGVEISHDVTSTTDRPPHVWQWTFVYKAPNFIGEFTFFIAPQGQRKALLIGTLLEFKKDAHAH